MNDKSPILSRRALLHSVLRHLTDSGKAANAQNDDSRADEDAPAKESMPRRSFLKTAAAGTVVAAAAPAIASIPGATNAAPATFTAANIPPLSKLLCVNAAMEAEHALLGVENGAIYNTTRNTLSTICKTYDPADMEAVYAHCDDNAIKTAGRMAHDHIVRQGRSDIPLSRCEDVVRQKLGESLEFCRSVMDGTFRRPDRESGKETSEIASVPSMLAFAIDICHVGMKWNPQSKRLTLTRPPLDALIADYQLAESPTGEMVATEGMTMAQKYALRDELMQQLQEMVAMHYPQAHIAFAGNSNILVEHPPHEMLNALGLDPAVAHQRNDAMPGRE